MKKFLLLSFVLVILIFGCSQPDNSTNTPTTPDSSQSGSSEVFAPTFIGDISAGGITSAIDATEITDVSEVNKFYYYYFTPALASFEKKELAENDSYTIKFLDKSVDIKYTKDSSGIQHFSGISADNDIYLSIAYNPETSTYDFTQAVILLASNANASSYNQIMISTGTGISVDSSGNSHGNIKWYVLAEGLNTRMFGDGDFYSDANVSAAMTTSLYWNTSYNTMDISIDNYSEVINFFESDTGNRQGADEAYCLVWFDKSTLSYDRWPEALEDYPGSLVPSTIASEAQAKATEISNGGWTITN